MLSTISCAVKARGRIAALKATLLDAKTGRTVLKRCILRSRMRKNFMDVIVLGRGMKKTIGKAVLVEGCGKELFTLFIP